MELNVSQVENLYLSSQEFLKIVESLPFNGTPSEFMANARSIIRDRRIANVTDRSVRVCFLDNLKAVYFYNLGFGTTIHNGKEVFTASYGCIEVVAAPLDQSNIKIYFDYRFENWKNYIIGWWSSLREGFESYGWEFTIDTAVPTTNNQTLSPELRDFLIDLRQKIDKRFDREELRDLCADLIGDYKEIEREDWKAFVLELTLWCLRHEQLPQLVELLREKRPQEDWGNLY